MTKSSSMFRAIARMRLCALFVAGALTGCAGTPVQLGSPSSTPVPAGAGRTITAEACGFQLLLLIPISVNSRMARAYESLQAQAAGAVITDVQVKESWAYGLVGTTYCTALQARAVQP